MTRERLEEGDRCRVSRGKRGHYFGHVKVVLPKGYLIASDGGELRRAREMSTRLIRKAPSSPRTSATPAVSADGSVNHLNLVAPVTAPVLLCPQPKPPKPPRSEAYLEWIRNKPCCNCDAPPRSDPHHEGEKGAGQKCSDFLAVPLCRKCHDTYTNKNALPDPHAFFSDTLRGRAESLVVLQREQAENIRHAVGRLDPEEGLLAMVHGMKSVSEERWREVLR